MALQGLRRVGAARYSHPHAGTQVGDVRDPQHVRSQWSEVAVDQVVGGCDPGDPDRRLGARSGPDARDTGGFISRATRFWPIRMPCSNRSSAWILGASYAPRLCSWICLIFSVSHASVTVLSDDARRSRCETRVEAMFAPPSYTAATKREVDCLPRWIRPKPTPRVRQRSSSPGTTDQPVS